VLLPQPTALGSLPWSAERVGVWEAERGHMNRSDSSSLFLLTLLPGVAQISAATGCRHRSSMVAIGVCVSVL